MTPFKIPKNNWKLMPIESLKFILDEGKDYLGYTLSESDKITNRAYSLIVLLSAILSAIVGYTFVKIQSSEISNTIFMNLYLSIIVSALIVSLATLVFPRSLMQKGKKPSKLAQESFLLNPKLSKDEIYLSFVIREIEDTQDKIDFNLLKNESRRNKLEVIMYLIAILLPIYLIISFCIIKTC